MTSPAQFPGASITVHSYRNNGYAPLIRWTCDASNFRDPIGQKQFKYLNGKSESVRDFVAKDPRVKVVIEEFCALAHVVIKEANERYVSFGVSDRHGLYIAPAIVEMLADALRTEGFQVYVQHHEIK